MALQNTKLLYLYSVLNSRVRLLVYAIRYWGKVKGIAGSTNATGNRLSNYTLTLLVLCYLQNVEPQVLPTIEQLSLLHGKYMAVPYSGIIKFLINQEILIQGTKIHL